MTKGVKWGRINKLSLERSERDEIKKLKNFKKSLDKRIRKWYNNKAVERDGKNCTLKNGQSYWMIQKESFVDFNTQLKIVHWKINSAEFLSVN